MPDRALFDSARNGELTGDALAAQVDRMLADSKIDRFIDDFPRQWLRLHQLGMFPPDGKLYPDYDVWLEASMREEVVHYFREVFANNLPIDTFLSSDWTMANPRLCDFYGLPEPKVSGFQRMSLRPDDGRGPPPLPGEQPDEGEEGLVRHVEEGRGEVACKAYY